jgi:hypothetical protein
MSDLGLVAMTCAAQIDGWSATSREENRAWILCDGLDLPKNASIQSMDELQSNYRTSTLVPSGSVCVDGKNSTM